MESQPPTDGETPARVRQQEVLADLSQQALETNDLDQLLHDATVAVGRTLGTEYATVLELLPDGEEILLRHGVGWRDGLVGTLTASIDPDSEIGCTLRTKEPVIVEDLRSEERFSSSELLTLHDVISGISVIIGSVEDPWGVLGGYTTENRVFTEHDAHFVQSVANILASAIENKAAQSELREVHERITSGILALNEAWEFTHVNQQAEETLGSDADELLGMTIWEAFPEVDGTVFEERYREAMAAQEPVSFEAYYPPMKAWFEEHVYPSESGLSVYFRDVTERKEREQALEERERQLSALIDNVPGMVYRCRNERGWPMEFVSDACEDVTGYESAALERNEVSWGEDIMVEEDREYLWETVQEDTVDEDSAFSATYRIETADGEHRWVRDYGRGIFDEDGDLVEIEGIISDITERKRRDQEHQRVVQALEAAREGLSLLDDDGEFIYVNDAYAETFGYEPEEMLGEHWDDLGIEANPEYIYEEVLPAVEYEGQWTGTTTCVRSDDSTFLAEHSLTQTTDDEIICVVRDVTDRRRMKAELDEILGRVTDAFYALDEDWRFTHVNDRAEELIDFTGEGLVGENVWDVFEWAADSKLRQEYERAMATQEPTSFELYYPEPLDAWFEVQAYPSETGLSVYFRDVTEQKEMETELEEIYGRISDAFFALDEDWRFTHVNERAHEIINPEDRELVGENVWEAFPAATERQFKPKYEQAMYEQETVSFEEYYPKPLDAWFEVRAYPSETGLSVYFRDVTERKEREAKLSETIDELQESEERLRLALEAGDMGTWELDLQKEDSPVRSPQHDRIFGYEKQVDDWDLETFLEHVHPDDRDMVQQSFDESFETGTWDFECRIVRTDGEERVISAQGEFYDNSEGKPARAVGVVQDVTERNRYQAELERALDLLEKTERIADVAGWEVDPETKEPYWSDHLFDLLDVDYDEQPTLEAALDVYHSAEDRAVVENAIEEALASGEPFDVEVRFPRPSGDVGWLRIQGDPKQEDGDVVSLRGAVQDVTEHKEREQRLEEVIERLEESNQRLEQFAYAASHDLQEPLRMVSSYLQLIEARYADALDEDGEEFLEFAVDGADRMREMIQGLLQYSRVDTQGDPFEMVDLEAVFADVRQDLQVKIAESDAEITTDALPEVYGDGGQLNQVFQNLLSNAIEYSGDEPPSIHVGAERDGNEWLISVTDQGVGIDPADQDRVFEVFESLHGQGESGTGIGLALCERIIERHGGDIWVDSAPGEGATFSFVLPAVEGSDADE